MTLKAVSFDSAFKIFHQRIISFLDNLFSQITLFLLTYITLIKREKVDLIDSRIEESVKRDLCGSLSFPKYYCSNTD